MKALIVDDERLARTGLRRLLGAGYPAIDTIAEAASVAEARTKIDALHPDLLFLDVQLRGETGFELLQELSAQPPVRWPKVIFTTAYDAYALRAFDFQAFDYLLKPVAPVRLAITLGRLLRPAGTGDEVAPSQNGVTAATAATAEAMPRLGEEDQVFLREGDRCLLAKVRDVLLIEAEADGSRVHLSGGVRLSLDRPLRELEARLDTRWFFRANRQQLVNLRWVQKVEPWFSGGLLAILPDGVKVELSRRQSQRFKEQMGF